MTRFDPEHYILDAGEAFTQEHDLCLCHDERCALTFQFLSDGLH